MPGLLEEFYSEDLNQYYYQDEDSMYYDDDFYYVDDDEEFLYYDDDEDFYYVDDDADFYYVDDDEDFYYVDDDEEVIYYQDEILYYDDDYEEEPAMYFKKEINVAPQTINTPRDAQGNQWDANSYEIDKEIESIAEEEGVDYSSAYRMFGQRYETYDPDLTEYM